ncbi:MAG: ribonuclease R [Bradyrhizobium sp.]|nr:MAG: ribonuclease R [Bradyrhizobium sp.]
MPPSHFSKGARRASSRGRKAPAGALPSREDLLAFIAGDSPNAAAKPGARITKREIARAFAVKTDDKPALKRLIKDLEADGAIVRGRKLLARAGRLPAMVVAEIAVRDRDGELIARPIEWDGPGEAPRILVRRPRLRRDNAPAPGLGARVLIRVEFDPDAGPKEPAYGGRVVKILDKAGGRALAVYRALENGAGRALSVEKRGSAREILIPAGMSGDAVEGDLVALEMLRERGFGLPSARVVERLGSVASERAISLIALAAHNIPHVFPPAALAAAEAAKPATLTDREDWRDLALVTIDPPDAKDHDDAVHVAADADPANPGGFIVTVAIADVACYVRAGSPLDKAALERGNSVYFPDRVVPMLPERISNDLCSLRPQEDRPALAVRMIMGADGRKRRHSFHRVMMRSAAKLSYEQAQAAIDGRPDATTAPLLETVLKPIYAAHRAIKLERAERNPLDLELPERKLVLDNEGKLAGVRWPERLDAHKLIEEFMILANVAAAETLEAAHSPLIYRAHDAPSPEKIGELTTFLATLGVKLAKGERMRPSHFNSVLTRVKGEPAETLINEVVLRAQSQAEYTHENYGHFGLNLRRYAHFTSPIRRYADLIVHRALIGALHLGSDGLDGAGAGELADIAERISAAERRAMAAERETADRLIAAHMANQVGAQFAARIAGVTKVGLFVRLRDTGADGFIPAGSLGADYFRFEEANRALVGTRTGETFRLGDSVEVRLLEAAPFAGALRFEMLSRGQRASRGKRERRR